MNRSLKADIILNIGAISVQGLALSREEAAILKESVETELRSLLTMNDSAGQFGEGGRSHRLTAPTIRIPTRLNTAILGQSIARSVFGGLSR